MVPLITNGLPASSASAEPLVASPRALPATVVGDASAVARQQLPSAVAASANLLAYAANTPTPLRPVLRSATPGASSALAAQFIAQIPGATSEELQIFVPRVAAQIPPPETAAQQAVRDIRVARGEVPAVTNGATGPGAATANNAPPATVNPVTATAIAINGALPPLRASVVKPVISALGLPGRKPGIAAAREGDLYRVATARNFNLTFPSTVSAVL